MRTLLRDPAAGLMHTMIYFGFLVLLGVTTVLEVDHQLPEDLKFLHGRTYLAYALVGDLAGVVFSAGIVWAIAAPLRAAAVSHPHQDQARARAHPRRVPHDRPQRFRRRDVRIAAGSASDELDYEKWSFVGYPLSSALRRPVARTLDRWHQWVWIGHVAAFVAFLAILPVTMLRHMFTSPLNMYLQGPGAAEGCDEADAEPDRDLARDVRGVGRRGLHVEATARHRRLHDVRPLHERVPGTRHRQAARPTARSCSRSAR